MTTYYYLSLFPMEGLVASQLEPDKFGAYMALGSRKGSAEQLIFAELKAPFGDAFDWDYADKRCVPHEDGTPKNSLYLSVYRALERVPLDMIERIYLTTRDGRTLALESAEVPADKRPFYLFQELCPITPLVVSRLNPLDFTKLITNPENKLHVPHIVFADLKVVNFDTFSDTGHVGMLYDRNIRHLKTCVDEVLAGKGKDCKVIDRSHVAAFGFQVIGQGIYVGDHGELTFFRMPDLQELEHDHYEWARSAQAL
jgi:hypothetical protein